MQKYIFYFLCFCSCTLGVAGEESYDTNKVDVTASPLYEKPEGRVKSPEEIQEELDQAEEDFKKAQKMFIPWYTGPLITGSAHTVPKGSTNIQGYFYITTQYGEFFNNRSTGNIPNITTLEPVFLYQHGLTPWWDLSLSVSGIFRFQNSYEAAEFNDVSFSFGFQLIKETPYIPAIRFSLGEIFPTGKYEHLDPNKNGIDGSGSGVYQTTVGLNFGKVLWWMPLHPMSLRLSSSYAIPTNLSRVEGFHSYGGGYNTSGKVHVGQTLNLDFGWEVSLTQKWVFAVDLAYTYSTKSAFSGTPGTTALGLEAQNGTNSSDNLSIAPAIEYNVSDHGGFIGGIWVPLTGRNSSNFVSVVLSFTWLF